MSATRPLTAKQQLFVEAYLGAARGSAAEAARLAGYRGNAKTLSAIGCENLEKPGIAAAVRGRLETAKGCMSADEVLEGISTLARSAERDADKLKALELLGRHHKIFERDAADAFDALARLLGVSREALPAAKGADPVYDA